MNAPQITLSQKDYEKISQLIYKNDSEVAALLEEELSRAEIVEPAALPADIVAMHSEVSYLEVDSGKESRLTLVYPMESDVEKGKISILASLGAALIGLRVGQTIRWSLPGGAQKEFKIMGVRR